MKEIPDNSIDMVLCDLPYGTTSCKWDIIIPFEYLWKEYARIIKPNCAIALFGTEPFSSMLRMSKLKWFKYDLVWKKSKSGSAFTAKYRPISKHEMISIFSRNGERTIYNPQMIQGIPYSRKVKVLTNNHNLGIGKNEYDFKSDGLRYPDTILDFQQKWRRQDQLHPTQKPVELLEYLIKTYTNDGGVVLDNCMGSGSTGVACINTNRNFIGFELEEEYFNMAKDRLNRRCAELLV